MASLKLTLESIHCACPCWKLPLFSVLNSYHLKNSANGAMSIKKKIKGQHASSSDDAGRPSFGTAVARRQLQTIVLANHSTPEQHMADADREFSVSTEDRNDEGDQSCLLWKLERASGNAVQRAYQRCPTVAPNFCLLWRAGSQAFSELRASHSTPAN